MYTEDNDIRTPRDRVSDELARQLLSVSRQETRDRRSAHRQSCACGAGIQPRQDACPLYPEKRGCACGDRGMDCRKYTLPLDFPLAIVYAPVQTWRGIYDERKALERGTLFTELDKPFEPKGRKCK